MAGEDEAGYFGVFSGAGTQAYVPYFSIELKLSEINHLCRTLGDAYTLWIKTLEPTDVSSVLGP